MAAWPASRNNTSPWLVRLDGARDQRIDQRIAIERIVSQDNIRAEQSWLALPRRMVQHEARNDNLQAGVGQDVFELEAAALARPGVAASRGGTIRIKSNSGRNSEKNMVAFCWKAILMLMHARFSWPLISPARTIVVRTSILVARHLPVCQAQPLS